MGAYVYRLKGTKAFDVLNIDGKLEKVYHYVYWYKPYNTGLLDKDPKWMKPIRMLDARLRKSFAGVEPVKWVRYMDNNGEKDNEVMEWFGGICISDYSERFNRARRIRLDVT